MSLLEWWDAAGEFHALPWTPDDGPIYRSSLLDHRNEAFRNGDGPPGFTSPMLDAVKRLESDGNVAPTVTDAKTQGDRTRG